jgi:hypothetical protein
VELPDLLVPRRAGFWRAGLVSTCAEAPHLDADDKRIGTEVTFAEYLWAAPAGEAASVRPETADERVGPCASRDISCDIDRGLQIFWVFPEFASVEQGLRASCGAHPDWTPGFAVQPLGDLSARLTVDAALGPRALTTLKAAFEEAKRREMSNQPGRPGEPSCASEAEFAPNSWHIEHEHGRWHAQGWSNTHRLCGYGFDFEAAVDLSPITGRTDASVSWDVLTARWPDATDVHSAPGAAWFVVETDRDLRVLGTAAAAAPLATISKGDQERVVMVEWATGSNVARWAAEVAQLKQTAGPAPRVIRAGR